MNHSDTSQQILDQQPEGILKAIESLIGTDDLLYYGPDKESESIKEGIVIYSHETPFGVKFRCGKISHRGGISGSVYFEDPNEALQYGFKMVDSYEASTLNIQNFSKEFQEKLTKRLKELASKTYWKIFKNSSHLFY